jgi:hypothetical protein
MAHAGQQALDMLGLPQGQAAFSCCDGEVTHIDWRVALTFL